MNKDTPTGDDTTNIITETPSLTLEEVTAKLNEQAEALKAADNAKAALQRKLAKFEKDAEDKEAKALAENGQFKELYEKAQAEMSAKEQQLNDRVIKAAVKSALQEAGAVSTDIVIKLVDLSKVKLNDDGEADLTEFTAQLEELKKSASMLFKTLEVPPAKRAGEAANKSAYEIEMRACKSQAEIQAVLTKYGK